MRIRTLAALAAGVAVGAFGSRLLDPETGAERRREAMRVALERGREVDWSAVLARTGEVAQELGQRAAEGYREGVATPAR